MMSGQPATAYNRQAKGMLKKLRVKAKHNNREFKVIGLSDRPCNQQLFSMKVKNGSSPENEETIEITVYEYFTKHRNIDLSSSAYMPCLDVGKPKRPNYMPLELCYLVSLQRYTRALSSVQRASLVEKSRQKPRERIKVITDAMREYSYDDDPLLASCGISIEKQLIQTNGRVLEAPKLKVGNGEVVSPCNGRWSFKNKVVLDLDETLICVYETSSLPAIMCTQPTEAGLKWFEPSSSSFLLVESVYLFCSSFQDEDMDSNMETPCSCCDSLKFPGEKEAVLEELNDHYAVWCRRHIDIFQHHIICDLGGGVDCRLEFVEI